VLLGHVNVVSTVTRLRAGRSGVRVPAETRGLFPLRMVQTGCGPTQLLVQWVPGYFHGHDVDHLSLSSAEVKKSGAVMRRPVYLDGLDRESFYMTQEK
jgi:hypothetical protein